MGRSRSDRDECSRSYTSIIKPPADAGFCPLVTGDEKYAEVCGGNPLDLPWTFRKWPAAEILIAAAPSHRFDSFEVIPRTS